MISALKDLIYEVESSQAASFVKRQVLRRCRDAVDTYHGHRIVYFRVRGVPVYDPTAKTVKEWVSEGARERDVLDALDRHNRLIKT
jgi:5-methylcytosine-specific restriction endonuclease McrA